MFAAWDEHGSFRSSHGLRGGSPFDLPPVAKRSDTAFFGRFFWEMLARGVYLPCSQYEAAFVSSAHTDDDIDQTILAARESLRAARA